MFSLCAQQQLWETIVLKQKCMHVCVCVCAYTVCVCVYIHCVCVQAKNMAAQRLRYIERYHDYTGGWLLVFPSQTTRVAQPTNKES